MNPKNYAVATVNGRKITKRRPELRNPTKAQKLREAKVRA